MTGPQLPAGSLSTRFSPPVPAQCMLRPLTTLTKALPLCANLTRPTSSSPPTRSLTHTMSGPAPIAARPFRLALVQLGGVGHDKARNLQQARDKIAEAAKGDGKGKVDLVVLPVSGGSTRRGEGRGSADKADVLLGVGWMLLRDLGDLQQPVCDGPVQEVCRADWVHAG